jgi:hypothetical protein
VIDINESGVFTGHTYTKDYQDYKTNNPQLRIIAFDTDVQRFDSIIYCYTPPRSDGTISVDISGLKCDLTYRGRSLPASLQIQMTKLSVLNPDTWVFLPGGATITTLPEDISSETFDRDQVRTNCVLVRNKTAGYKAASDLQSLLKRYVTLQSSGPVFEARVYDANAQRIDNSSLTGEGAFLRVNRSKANAEQRFLGELATDLTFFVYGFTKLPSKIRGGRDNGVDGVFVDSVQTPTIVYITESKFQSERFSEKEFEQRVGIDSLRKRIPNDYPEKTVLGGILAKALAGNRLNIVGQTYLSDGHMASPYCYFVTDVIHDILDDKLRKTLITLRDTQYKGNAAALARAIDVNAKTLGTFLGNSGGSPKVKGAFLIYVNRPENQTLYRQLFPPEVKKEEKLDQDYSSKSMEEGKVEIPRSLLSEMQALLQKYEFPEEDQDTIREFLGLR